MIIAFKHENMNSKILATLYTDILSFALSNFVIDVSEDGIVSIGNWTCSISYNMKSYNEAEVRTHFINSYQFKSFAKSRFWSVYSIKDKLI